MKKQRREWLDGHCNIFYIEYAIKCACEQENDNLQPSKTT